MTKIITPKCRLSYPNLLEPREDQQGKPWYSAQLVFEKGTDLSAIKAAILETAKEKFGDKAADMLRTGRLKTPLRTDWEAKGYPEDSTFFSCKTRTRPDIVGPYAGADGKPKPWTEDIYAGIYARASIGFYFYPQQGGGIGAGLRNVQILGGGDHFDGRLSASDEFEAVKKAPVNAEDLDDLF